MADFGVHHRHTGGHATLVATEEFLGRTRLRFSRTLSRGSLCELDVYDPTTDPAVDSYLEVRYGSDVAWSGTIREAVERQDEPGRWRIVAADALAIVQRRTVASRETYASTDERTVVLDILDKVGITTTSSPIRFKTASILNSGTGNAIDSHRVEFDGCLAALQQLAVAFNRTILVKREDIGGTFYWVVYYGAAADLFAAGSQGTWTAGSQIDTLEDITDTWDKTGAVTVLGQGDGTSVPEGASGAGGTSDPRAVLPVRSLQSNSLAASVAGTIQSAFGSNRRVFVATLQWQDPMWEGDTVSEGEIVTLQDRDGGGLGDYRVVAVECDEDLSDGWSSRATLIGTGVPILPSVTSEAGLRMPGITDVQDIVDDHARYRQVSDLVVQPQVTALDVTRTIAPDSTDGYSENINLAETFVVNQTELVTLRFQIAGPISGVSYYWHLRLLASDGSSIMPDGPILDSRENLGRIGSFDMGSLANFNIFQIYYTVARSQLEAGETAAKLEFAIGSTEAAPGTNIDVSIEVTATKEHRHNN